MTIFSTKDPYDRGRAWRRWPAPRSRSAPAPTPWLLTADTGHGYDAREYYS